MQNQDYTSLVALITIESRYKAGRTNEPADTARRRHKSVPGADRDRILGYFALPRFAAGQETS